jgi:hypothetical protein
VYCLRYVLGNNHIDLFVYEYFTRIVLKMFSVFALALWWWFECRRGWPVDHLLISQAPANRSARVCLFPQNASACAGLEVGFATSRRGAKYPAL